MSIEIVMPKTGLTNTENTLDAWKVSEGDTVKKGQTVCLIEAMKMMSEVPAPCDCVIESVCKSNGELVAFGEPLFRYRPC